MPARYAVYFAPEPETPLWRFGRAWLGRCADSGEPVAPLAVPGLDLVTLGAITEAPRLYGWHATLKPPFALRPGAMTEHLLAALGDLAALCPAIDAPALKMARLGDFLALIPVDPSPVVTVIAALCVERLDGLRAPPDAAELARRRAAGLTERQDALLARWGYPYVMDEYRFHMTLTGALAAPLLDRAEAALRPLVARFAGVPLRFDQVALFRQDAPGGSFTIVRRFPLAGTSAPSSATNCGTDRAIGASFSKCTTSQPSGT